MDSLKTLMDKGEYELVLKLTENCEDYLASFYRLSALLAVGRSEDALSFIKQKRNILLENPMLLMKFHIELLCLLERFDEAFEELEYYKNLPYENQETEEYLKALPKYIRDMEISIHERKEVGQEATLKKLQSNNDDEVLAALGTIDNGRPLEPFLTAITQILKSPHRQVVRSFALLVLVAKKYPNKVQYLYFDEMMEVIPSELNEPFVLPNVGNMDKISALMQEAYHNPSVKQNALNLLSSYLVLIYPKIPAYTKEQLLVVFGVLARAFLQMKDQGLEKLCEKYGLDQEEMSKEIKKVKDYLEEF